MRLTRRQHQILEFIAEATDEHGYPPSVREIGNAVGLLSPSSVHYQLRVLEQAGYIQRDPRRARARILSEPQLALDIETTTV